MPTPMLANQSPGLTAQEAERRFAEYGPNALAEQVAMPLWLRVLRQFKSPLIYILLFALGIDAVIWTMEGARTIPVESIAIGLILILNAGLGTYQESKAEAALAKLKAMGAALVWVLRDNVLVHLPSEAIVPGDLIRLEAGDRVPADAMLVTGQGVLSDESILTGESLPVEKADGDEVLSGTLLVRGKSYAEVTRTGSQSAMGRLAGLIAGLQAEGTPLERRLKHFGHQIAYVILALAVVLTLGGILVEGIERVTHVFMFSVALAVAAIPESLPAVLTLALALGVERMAARKAIVRKLSAVEALGSVTVIATDKTGTLTENKMHVKSVDAPDRERALRAMVLANDAELDTQAGDTLELALLGFAKSQGVDPAQLVQKHARLGTRPFDSTYKFMSVTVDEGGEEISYLKGAPEVLLGRSHMPPADREEWERKVSAYAGEGYRVLAVAWRKGREDDGVHFLGLISMWDPPRPEVREAVAHAKDAGVRVLMITGDHPATAQAVAGIIGISGTEVVVGAELDAFSPNDLKVCIARNNIFARVTPEHKLRLVQALKESGEIVAVTGDGVNDAPALKRADVGVAMGQRGSDVSREVADIVLLDDNFATIVAAIEEGRSIYENIQKIIRFLFSTNFALVLLVLGGLGASFVFGFHDPSGGMLLPLTAVQLLWINVIADGPPALALTLDRNPTVLGLPPRNPRAPLLDRASLRFILVTGIVKAGIGLALFLLMPRFGYGPEATRTVVFLYESLAQLVFAYPARHVSLVPLRNNWLHVAVIGGAALQIATVFFPPLRFLLGLEWLDTAAFAVVGGSVLLSWGFAELLSRRQAGAPTHAG